MSEVYPSEHLMGRHMAPTYNPEGKGQSIYVPPPQGAIQVMGVGEKGVSMGGWSPNHQPPNYSQGHSRHRIVVAPIPSAGSYNQPSTSVTLVQESACKRSWPWLFVILFLTVFCIFFAGPLLEAYSFRWFSGRCRAMSWREWSPWSQCHGDNMRSRHRTRDISPARPFSFSEDLCHHISTFSVSSARFENCSKEHPPPKEGQSSSEPAMCIPNTWGEWSSCARSSGEKSVDVRFRHRTLRSAKGAEQYGYTCHTIQTMQRDYNSCPESTALTTQIPTTNPMEFDPNMGLHAACTCGGTYKVSSGIICSPGYPGLNYKPNMTCSYYLEVPEESRVAIHVLHSYTEACCDYILFYEGHSTSDSNLIDLFSGKRNASTFLSESNKITMLFRSDYNIEYPGFMAVFFPVDKKGSVMSQLVTTTRRPMREGVEGEECSAWFPTDKERGWSMRVYGGGVSQEDAKAVCEAENARLASILDWNEHTKLWGLVESNRHLRGRNVWIGLERKRGEEGREVWGWTDGISFDNSFAPWAENQPRKEGDCVFAQGGEKWWTGDCNATLLAHGFACKRQN